MQGEINCKENGPDGSQTDLTVDRDRLTYEELEHNVFHFKEELKQEKAKALCFVKTRGLLSDYMDFGKKQQITDWNHAWERNEFKELLPIPDQKAVPEYVDESVHWLYKEAIEYFDNHELEAVKSVNEVLHSYLIRSNGDLAKHSVNIGHFLDLVSFLINMHTSVRCIESYQKKGFAPSSFILED